jgi:hypothetical protein
MLSRAFPGPASSGNVCAMSDGKISEAMRALAEQQGLQRALQLFPDEVRAAAERGLRPLGDPPGGLPPIAHPAPVFDPAQYEGGE